jgi:hypothetical protein
MWVMTRTSVHGPMAQAHMRRVATLGKRIPFGRRQALRRRYATRSHSHAPNRGPRSTATFGASPRDAGATLATPSGVAGRYKRAARDGGATPDRNFPDEPREFAPAIPWFGALMLAEGCILLFRGSRLALPPCRSMATPPRALFRGGAVFALAITEQAVVLIEEGHWE